MKDQFGLNMRSFCRTHEDEVIAALDRGAVTPALLERHRERLAWLQHERLVHLIVVALTSIAELFTLDLTLLHPSTHPGSAAALLALAVLLGFYFAHYFLLENTTQRWYLLTDALRAALEGRDGP